MTTPRTPPSPEGATVRWTHQAKAFAVASAFSILAGAITGSLPLVILGASLAAWLIMETLLVGKRLPRARLHVEVERLQEGEETRVEVKADDLRPNHQIHVALSPSLEVVQGTNLIDGDSSGQRSQSFRIAARARGPQNVGPILLRTWSPSRLLVREVETAQVEALKVVPRLELVRDVNVFSKTLKPMGGRFSMNRPGQGFEVFALRPYQSGDTIRDINWKATARTGDPIVNQRIRETQSDICFLVDARVVEGLGPAGSTPLDRSCRAALALYEDAVGHRDIVHFLVFGQGTESLIVKGEDRIFSLEDRLGGLAADGMESMEEAWRNVRLDMRSSGPVFLFSSLQAAPEAEAAVRDMVGRGHPVTVISPEPGPTSADMNVDTKATREHGLRSLRRTGAVVVDWAQETHLAAPPAQVHTEWS